MILLIMEGNYSYTILMSLSHPPLGNIFLKDASRIAMEFNTLPKQQVKEK